MTSLFPRLRGTGTHRADDRIAELTATYEKQLADLREENVLLHEQRAAADDWFMLLDQHRKELEVEVERLKGQLAEEREACIAVGKDRDALDRYVHDLEKQLADVERRLDIRTWAEAAAAKTQEMPVITAVMPLSQAPFATVDPGRI
ncbi:hypothetical protein ACFWIO_35690 [Streptomyces diastatochromogenes]|uniref:hypothetical protein n=1 Tax=Streptomyces diastatochromogenes TaxID=42236 RepID=UPI00364738B5